ncbi:phage shock protein PspC (stress-responsive transcriptional regulator) [Nocardiopsis mwathae]|uniref:Phage shock protein PspC (Stress-responsive transcriptional regulator) n=1 Tax=Nocardiopsis mwathae TaxID=1472723 RepID=A0A7W9YD55_9ACTN|nr:PspC domain-containing protein [Nocardiopsis mwathae]MBB6169990.1 phage shock protein PspC (stress-responsive transcriptional regulator) [Nocardiopsis mwathae]
MTDGREPANDTGGPASASGDSPFTSEERELRRHSETGVVTGVCAGLGEYTRIDPVVWRVAFALTALSAGVGVMLYIAAWTVMRDQQGGPAMAEQLLNRRIEGRAVPALLGAGLAAAAALSLVGGFGWGTLVLATPLILGVLVAHNRGVDLRRTYRELPSLLKSREPPPTAPAPEPSPSYYNPAQPWAQAPSGPIDLAVVSGQEPGTAEPQDAGAGGPDAGDGAEGGTRDDGSDWERYMAESARERARAREARRRRKEARKRCGVPLLALVLWAVLAVTGLAFALAGEPSLTALVGPVTGPLYVGGVVVIIGLALLVGAWAGNPRGLITLGVLATLLLVAVSTVNVTAMRFGTADWRPQSAAEATRPFDLTMGAASLDLTRVDLEPGQRVEVAADVAVGRLDVTVPDAARVEVHAATRLGAVAVDDVRRSGTRLDMRMTLEPSGAEAPADGGPEASAEPPTVALALTSYVAEMEVRRETA